MIIGSVDKTAETQEYFSALRLNKGYDKMNSVTKKNSDYFWSDSIKREITFSYGM